MKIPFQWIQKYTDIPVSAPDFAEAMVMHGTGVEGVEDQNDALHGVVVGRILSIARHENSDHMVVCQVDVGEDEPLQIVTGAPNVHEGDLVPVARVGAVLPGGKRIEKSRLRGVDSYGMCCSGPELGVPEYLYPSVGDKGLLIFHEDYAPGSDVRPILGVDQTVVDFEILANRPDCLSVWGIAREAAATLRTTFRKPVISGKKVPGKVSDSVAIDVQDPVLCPRYCAMVVRNVRIGPSPMWMRKALHASGVRAINNIVDITNYVMLETGHPMHAFDLAKVRDRHIIVRRARPGETIVTLDGKERPLTTDMLMIADQEKATGIAGVMGGEESEITEETRDVLFEIAAFDRTSIRLTTRALGLRTEASGRFERGVNAATCREAGERACQLVSELDAGDVVDDVFDYYPNPRQPLPIEASVSGINARTGVAIPGEEMARILRSLDMQATLDGDQLTVLPPVEREDIENEADCSEEVLRMYGYEHIEPTPLRGETRPGTRNAHMRLADRAGHLLTAKGFYETRSFSFISSKAIEKLGLPEGDRRREPLAIRNPLGEDTSVMRTTLVPSMLATLALNQNRNNERAQLFEHAPVFEPGAGEDGLPLERPMLCLGAYGDGLDFFFLRDALTDMFAQLGLAPDVARQGEPYLHPGRSACLTCEGTRLAVLGEVHPNVLAAFELSRRCVIAEVDLSAVFGLVRPFGHVRALSGFPAVARDLALVMREETMVGDVVSAIRQAGGPLMNKAEVFDIYRGAPMLPGMKSVAFSLTFRSEERTLTEEDIAPAMKQILEVCSRRFGAVLRA